MVQLQAQVAYSVDRSRADAAAGRARLPPQTIGIRSAPTVNGVPNEGIRHVCSCGAYRMLWDVFDTRAVGAVQCVTCGAWEECSPGGRRFPAPALGSRCGACAGRGGAPPSTRCPRCLGTGVRMSPQTTPSACLRCDGLRVTLDDGFTPEDRETFYRELVRARGLGAQVGYSQERAREIPCPRCTRTTTSPAPAPQPAQPARPTRCGTCDGRGVVHPGGQPALEVTCSTCRGSGRTPMPAPARSSDAIREAVRPEPRTYDASRVQVSYGMRTATPMSVVTSVPPPPRATPPRAARPVRKVATPKLLDQRRELDLDVEAEQHEPAAPAVARRDLDLD